VDNAEQRKKKPESPPRITMASVLNGQNSNHSPTHDGKPPPPPHPLGFDWSIINKKE